MIIPVVIIPWRAVRVLLIVMAIVFGLVVLIPAALYVMQAFFEPVPKETGSPVPGVKVRR
jgi:hypothetical protein